MRAAVQNLEESRIREVANAGADHPDVLAFWFGESDEPPPAAVRQAVINALLHGETHHARNFGLPELRRAIADYTCALHPSNAVGPERIAVTSGGVNALMLTLQALLVPGDDVVAVTPAWPNLTAQPAILGASLRTVALTPPAEGDLSAGWTLDLPALLEAIRPGTQLLIVNAPNNPTGWTLTTGEQRAILARCRETGTWILADEVYERLYYTAASHACAPSFLDVAEPHDRLVVIHSFSKSFLMTGWRLGWLVMPSMPVPQVGRRVEFSIFSTSVFTQRAGLAALQQAPDATPHRVAHLHACRNLLMPRLRALPGVQAAAAPGGMYAFFRLRGHADSVRTAQRLVAEVGLGLAPGITFGPAAQGWLRWCFAVQDPQRLEAGVERLQKWLGL